MNKSTSIYNKDYSISLTRLIATSFIVICHIMQYLGAELAWWFNVGVQMFLCMSGFLYGRREIKDAKAFYKKQLSKILIDYYIVILTVSLLQFILLPEEITLVVFAKSLIAFGTLGGGTHLWYIPYILLCYIACPVLSWMVRQFYSEGNQKKLITYSLATMAVVLVLFSTFFSYFNSAWINCFIIGFILGFCEESAKSAFKTIYISILAAAVSMNTVRIAIDYLLQIKFDGVIGMAYSLFKCYSHVALGCSIFLAIRSLLSRKMSGSNLPGIIKKPLDFSDRLSYDVYLVHQFIILGPMSLMALTKITALNVIVIVTLTTVLALIVNFTSGFLNSIPKKMKNIKQ